ncbi:glycosyltransferase family 2 protein [Alcanivorax jadensis]|uniref:glycosyltransferase family 2 protein n=1 Tax=Alcanivorax jadensis TaxID=64988 RepID=UPI0039C87157
MQISVVIPSFNAASYLQQTLASAEKAIGDAKVEVIVVDDGSTSRSGTASAMAPWRADSQWNSMVKCESVILGWLNHKSVMLQKGTGLG